MEIKLFFNLCSSVTEFRELTNILKMSSWMLTVKNTLNHFTIILTIDAVNIYFIFKVWNIYDYCFKEFNIIKGIMKWFKILKNNDKTIINEGCIFIIKIVCQQDFIYHQKRI
jgi:hypothetical protein